MDRKVAAELIAGHEGKRTRAYHDSLGILTVGIGCNLETKDAPERIAALGVDYGLLCNGQCELTEEHVMALFDADLYEAITTARSMVSNFDEQPDDVQHVIVDMVFNMGGPRFRQFKKFIAALEARQYRAAAAEMADSRWAEQVPNRADVDIALMLNNV